MILPQIAFIPTLYVVQEVTLRLGIFTQQGHGERIREHFGGGWPALPVARSSSNLWARSPQSFPASPGLAAYSAFRLGSLYPPLSSSWLPSASAAAIAVVGSFELGRHRDRLPPSERIEEGKPPSASAVYANRVVTRSERRAQADMPGRRSAKMRWPQSGFSQRKRRA